MRDYLVEDLAIAQSLETLGGLSGVWAVDRENPEENRLDSPWWTGGQCMVLWLSKQPVPIEEIELIPWRVRLYSQHEQTTGAGNSGQTRSGDPEPEPN